MFGGFRLLKNDWIPAVYALPKVSGKHVIYDLLGGNPHLLDDIDFVTQAITEAVEASGATLLGINSHRFEPQGVTAVALLSESHLSVHTWPEHGYAAIDCFTCGEHTDPEAACHSMKYSFEATHGSMRLLRREGPTFNHPEMLHQLSVIT